MIIKKINFAILMIYATVVSLNAMDKISPLIEEEAKKSLITITYKDKPNYFWPEMVNTVFQLRNEIIPDLKNQIIVLDSAANETIDQFINSVSEEIAIGKEISQALTKEEIENLNNLQLINRMEKHFTTMRICEKTYKRIEAGILEISYNPQAIKTIIHQLRKQADEIWIKHCKQFDKMPTSKCEVYYSQVVQEIMPEKCVVPVVLRAYFDACDVILPGLQEQLEIKQKAISLKLFMGYTNITDLRSPSWRQIINSMDNPKESLNTLSLMEKYFRDIQN